MSTPTYDVVAIGNAIVDILSSADDAFIAEIGVAKGSMQLMFSSEEADALYAKMGPGMEISGGSAANLSALVTGRHHALVRQHAVEAVEERDAEGLGEVGLVPPDHLPVHHGVTDREVGADRPVEVDAHDAGVVGRQLHAP